jgi:hypothetical protein
MRSFCCSSSGSLMCFPKEFILLLFFRLADVFPNEIILLFFFRLADVFPNEIILLFSQWIKTSANQKKNSKKLSLGKNISEPKEEQQN